MVNNQFDFAGHVMKMNNGYEGKRKYKSLLIIDIYFKELLTARKNK